MAALNEKIRRAIQNDHDAEAAFEKLVKSGCDKELLFERVAWVAAACGMVELRKMGVVQLPGDVLPVKRAKLRALPKQLRDLADTLDAVNRSQISPVRYAARERTRLPTSREWAPTNVEQEVLSKTLHAVAVHGSRLPALLRAYAAVLSAAARVVPRLLPRDFFNRTSSDAEALLIDYVKKSTGRPHFTAVNVVLRVGCAARGRLAPPENRYGDVNATALKERYMAAKKRPIPGTTSSK